MLQLQVLHSTRSSQSWDTSPDFILMKIYMQVFPLSRNSHVDNIFQYIHGSIAKEDWAHFRDHTLTVSKVILTNVTKSFEEHISSSPAVYFRLALSQEPGIPFFPHLSDLIIVDSSHLSWASTYVFAKIAWGVTSQMLNNQHYFLSWPPSHELPLSFNLYFLVQDSLNRTLYKPYSN
jgi:hypothetical protein